MSQPKNSYAVVADERRPGVAVVFGRTPCGHVLPVALVTETGSRNPVLHMAVPLGVNGVAEIVRLVKSEIL